MKILLVDDEAPARMRLASIIDEMGGCEVALAENGDEALACYQQFQPEIVLLDIRMPGMDGLEVACHLSSLEKPPAVIFTTAYDDYALHAFDAQAVDYLLKPIRQSHLVKALAKARQLNRAQLRAINCSAPTARARSHISAQSRGRIELIPVDEIVYFQASQKYVAIHHRDGELLIEEPLKSLEREFGDRFVRIHRNALVARACLVSLSRARTGAYQVTLKGSDNCLEVSRRHLPSLRAFFS
ncbi:MAG: response regulator transcription factor [Gammaproteobacteria bacterium]|nr:response regulator transcription factor [Gammaproteobacteria bacterium]